jgi:hypothetical protein
MITGHDGNKVLSPFGFFFLPLPVTVEGSKNKPEGFFISLPIMRASTTELQVVLTLSKATRRS